MIDVPIIGLTGRIGAGKDTVHERLVALGGERFQRRSFAAPLKASVAALFGITVEQIEEWKNDPLAKVTLTRGDYTQAMGFDNRDHPIAVRELTLRELLQRYGTEAHREVFGENFWTDQAMRDLRLECGSTVYVFTDVRFDNEAKAIVDRGGVVWRIVGPDDDTGAHASEAGVDPDFVSETIDNTYRDKHVVGVCDHGEEYGFPDFTALDDQVATLIHGGTLR